MAASYALGHSLVNPENGRERYYESCSVRDVGLAERLRERMEEVGVSQSELGRRVGISQSAINRLTSGQNYGSKHLHRIARELGTTPAYLEGETDDPDADAPDLPAFSAQHLELFDCFEALPPVQQTILLGVAQSMAGRGPQGKLQAAATDYRAEPARSQDKIAPDPVPLPPPDALEQMFEALLAGIDPTASRAEQALLLSERLPIGLAQLQGARRVTIQRQSKARAAAAPTREPQRQS